MVEGILSDAVESNGLRGSDESRMFALKVAGFQRTEWSWIEDDGSLDIYGWGRFVP